MKRSSGVLLHITSLPGRYGVGTLGNHARRFADFCHQAGLSWWQILPVGPAGNGNSPYQSDSVFAGNPDLIDLEQLIEWGLLKREECDRLDWGNRAEQVCFEKLHRNQPQLLRLAFARAKQDNVLWEQVQQFVAEQEWLDDYALYLALKQQMGGKPWQQWDAPLARRDQKALKLWKERLQEKMEYHCWVQYLFFEQWAQMKEYCNRKGVRLIGDIPIYVAPDSCDTWVNSRLFEYDEDFHPLRVAGCPPDYFSKTGQLWGNPLYRWDVMEKEGFDWWITRIRAMSRLFDLTRIDHFRGFAGYYAIDADAPTAENGRWEKGPGEKFFDTLFKQLPNTALIAEDLGIITKDVEQLRDHYRLPGMKILQFAFSAQEQSSYLPHNCPKRAVIYTGTHDNDTTRGWAAALDKQQRRMASAYLGVKKEADFSWAMIRAAWNSCCELAIAPMQDFLNLPSTARMNTPSTVGDNWSWRMLEGQADKKLAKQIRRLNQASWRMPQYKTGIRAKQKEKQEIKKG